MQHVLVQITSSHLLVVHTSLPRREILTWPWESHTAQLSLSVLSAGSLIRFITDSSLLRGNNFFFSSSEVKPLLLLHFSISRTSFKTLCLSSCYFLTNLKFPPHGFVIPRCPPSPAASLSYSNRACDVHLNRQSRQQSNNLTLEKYRLANYFAKIAQPGDLVVLNGLPWIPHLVVASHTFQIHLLLLMEDAVPKSTGNFSSQPARQI